MGLPGAVVRINQIVPRFNSSSDAFEQAMTEEILPAVYLGYNRLGHSTDSQLLLKEERLAFSPEDGDRYQWWISRTLSETFKEQDRLSFRNNVRDPINKFEQVGDLREFSDYQILSVVDLRQG